MASVVSYSLFQCIHWKTLSFLIQIFLILLAKEANKKPKMKHVLMFYVKQIFLLLLMQFLIANQAGCSSLDI